MVLHGSGEGDIMSNPTKMKCVVDGHPELTVTIDLAFGWQHNPASVIAVLDCYNKYGLYCFMGHVVVSGANVWMPTRVSFTGSSYKVTRQVRDVYLYAPGESIAFTYGEVTEGAGIPKFGEVLAADADKLTNLGDFVWQNTVLNFSKKPVFMSMIPF